MSRFTLKWIMRHLLKTPSKFATGAHLACFVTFTVTCFSFLLLSFPVVCQDEENLSHLSRPYDNAKSTYLKAVGSEFGLYSGVSYKEYVQRKNDEGQPYFETNKWIDGNILYDGLFYENAPLLYDLVNDKVVTSRPYGAVKLELISEKIDHFDINGHRFIRLVTTNNTLPEPGFFELLHDGKYQLYVKWRKIRTEVIIPDDIHSRYEDQNQIYIYKENKFHKVTSKSSVLQVLEDKKQLLQKYIKVNRLTFKSQRIESINKMLAYYESGIE